MEHKYRPETLHEAALAGDTETAKLILEDAVCHDLNRKKEPFGWTPLHLSVKYEALGVTRALLRAKASVTLEDKQNMNAMDWALRKMEENQKQTAKPDYGAILKTVDDFPWSHKCFESKDQTC